MGVRKKLKERYAMRLHYDCLLKDRFPLSFAITGGKPPYRLRGK
jgi:hypothetical protein